ncbi:MAG: radical SAM family heme chaperone HemW [bacterium]|nr:radical SAM family heme chaperone HemW [bacterium]
MEDLRVSRAALEKRPPLELYFHIPFCARKCLYCDFLSGPGDEETKSAYLRALRQETEERAGECGDHRVVSVFIGGGTPSVVAPEQLTALLETVRKCYRLEQDAEITIEVNPGTADGRKLKTYRQAGVNRLSIGLQSAEEEELKRLGRIHTAEEFRETYRAAVAAGFDNINVDVMSGLPGQTPESWRRTLDAVLGLAPQPTHISAYSLILEEGTPFFEMAGRGELKLPEEETDRLMYHETAAVLSRAGYRRYEISNYAKPGFECRHNCGYWTRREYMGFGVGAASLMGETRFRNGDSLKAYLQDPLGCREEIQRLSREEQMEEFLFLGLRLTEGIAYGEFAKKFGCTLWEIYGKIVEKNKRDGLLKETGPKERLALTEKGLDLANYVMAQFLLT